VDNDITIEVIERRAGNISIYTVLLNDWVYLITRDRKLIEKFKKKKNG
jgi:hypothetical protein